MIIITWSSAKTLPTAYSVRHDESGGVPIRAKPCPFILYDGLRLGGAVGGVAPQLRG